MFSFLLINALLSYGVLTVAVETLEFDVNRRLSRNSILYQDSAYCQKKIETRWNQNNPYANARNLIPMSSSILQSFVDSEAKTNVETTCFAVCVDTGLAEDLIPYPVPFYVYAEHSALDDSENDLTSLVNSCKAAEVGFISYYPKEAQVYWLNNEGKRHKMGTLKYGERHTLWQRTFLGHVYEICDMESDELIMRHTVMHHAHVVVGQAYQVAAVNKSIHSSFNFEQVSTKVKQAMSHEWLRCNRVKRTYTPLGFAKGRLPNDVWGSISAYQYNNKDNGNENKGFYLAACHVCTRVQLM
jgi:hypothetical protein